MRRRPIRPGAATNGEVEDYRVTITNPVERHWPTVQRPRRSPAAPTAGRRWRTGQLRQFGGVDRRPRRRRREPTWPSGRLEMTPAEVIAARSTSLFMNANGTVKSRQKIASGIGGGPTHRERRLLRPFDGVTWGSGRRWHHRSGRRQPIWMTPAGTDRGAVYVLFMNANGTVKGSQKIASGIGGGPTLANGDRFGIFGDIAGRPRRRWRRRFGRRCGWR